MKAKKLSELKEGDEAIFVRLRDSGEERSVDVIERVKGNRIHCGAARFDRDTGLPVGSWLGDWTKPKIAELRITFDRGLLARLEGEIGFDLFIGAESDLIRNIHGVAGVAGLDGDEVGFLLGRVAEIKGTG